MDEENDQVGAIIKQQNKEEEKVNIEKKRTKEKQDKRGKVEQSVTPSIFINVASVTVL